MGRRSDHHRSLAAQIEGGSSRLVAFGDESSRPMAGRTERHYALAMVTMMSGDLPGVIESLGNAAGRGVRLHYADNASVTARQRLTQAVADVPDWEADVFETSWPRPRRGNSEAHLRSKILRAGLIALNGGGVSQLILESRGAGANDAADHRDLQHVIATRQVDPLMRLQHQTKERIELAIADAVASSRTDQLCDRAREPFLLLAHRCRTHQVL